MFGLSRLSKPFEFGDPSISRANDRFWPRPTAVVRIAEDEQGLWSVSVGEDWRRWSSAGELARVALRKSGEMTETNPMCRAFPRRATAWSLTSEILNR